MRWAVSSLTVSSMGRPVTAAIRSLAAFGLGALANQGVGQRGDGRIQRIHRHHLAHQADGQRPLGRNTLGALKDAQRVTRPDGAQHIGADHRRDDSELHF